jgi:hypothetical protein
MAMKMIGLLLRKKYLFVRSAFSFDNLLLDISRSLPALVTRFLVLPVLLINCVLLPVLQLLFIINSRINILGAVLLFVLVSPLPTHCIIQTELVCKTRVVGH